MTTVELTDANFENTITQDGIVFVDFWAPWCGPCKAFGPIYEKVAAQHPDITFAKLNTEDQPQTAGALQVSAIPTLMIFRDGIGLFSQPGMLPEEALNTLVEKTREIDMAEVRAEVAKQQGAADGPTADADDKSLN